MYLLCHSNILQEAIQYKIPVPTLDVLKGL